MRFLGLVVRPPGGDTKPKTGRKSPAVAEPRVATPAGSRRYQSSAIPPIPARDCRRYPQYSFVMPKPENTDELRFALVAFVVEVEGFGNETQGLAPASRHVVAASWCSQDPDESTFVNDNGEVVARWPTPLIKSIEWLDAVPHSLPSPESMPAPDSQSFEQLSVGTKEWRKKVSERHPNAYKRWDPGEDDLLTQQYNGGMSVQEMSATHGRRTGGIMSRLARLGLVDPQTSIGTVDKAELRNKPKPNTPTAVDQAPPIELTQSNHEACRHDLTFLTCTICKNDGRPSVHISAGGTRYHKSAKCSALLAGQAQVAERDGIVSDIKSVHPGSALLEGRSPCQTCSPQQIL